MGNANANSNNTENNPTLGLMNPTITLDNPTLALSAMAMSPGPHSSSYQCPICEIEFTTCSEVEVHVNVEHRDILSPQKSVSTFQILIIKSNSSVQILFSLGFAFRFTHSRQNFGIYF